MKKIDIAKNVTSIFVGMGTGKVVNGIIANNTSAETVIDKIAIGSSSVVIGSMASAATKEHTGKMIDELVEAFGKIQSKFN